MQALAKFSGKSSERLQSKFLEDILKRKIPDALSLSLVLKTRLKMGLSTFKLKKEIPFLHTETCTAKCVSCHCKTLLGTE